MMSTHSIYVCTCVCVCVCVCKHICVFVRANTERTAFLVSFKQADPRPSEQREVSDIFTAKREEEEQDGLRDWGMRWNKRKERETFFLDWKRSKKHFNLSGWKAQMCLRSLEAV